MRVRAIILCLKFRFQLGLLKQHSHFSASRLITARIALWLNALAPSSPTVTCSSSRRRPNLRPERPRSRRQCRAGKDAATVLGSGTHPDAARYPTPPFSSGNGSGKFLMQSLRWCTGATIAFGVLLSGVTNWQPRSLLHTQRGNLAVDAQPPLMPRHKPEARCVSRRRGNRRPRRDRVFRTSPGRCALHCPIWW